MSVLEISYSVDGRPGIDRVVFTQNDTVEFIASDVRSKLEAIGLQAMAHEVFAVIAKTTHEQLLRFTCECGQGSNTVSIATMQPFPYRHGSRHSSGGWGGG